MIKNELEASLKDAMKTGDVIRRDILRVVLTNIKIAEVDKGTTLDDAAVISLLQKEVKTHKESIEAAKTANRVDLESHYTVEMEILEKFLPEQMQEDEIRSVVRDAIVESGAATPADMGKVMKLVLPRVEGKASNSEVSRITREMLTA